MAKSMDEKEARAEHYWMGIWKIARKLETIETSDDPLDMIILEKVLVTVLSQEHILDNDESDINLCGVELLVDVKEKLVSFTWPLLHSWCFHEFAGSITNLLQLYTLHFNIGSPIAAIQSHF